MYKNPRHRATTSTVRRLRRAVLSTALATMALTTAAASGSAFAVTRTATVAPTGPSAWEEPVPATSQRPLADRPRALVRAGRLENVPDPALAAYQRSAAILREASPRCRPHWTLLAAIGRVATDHGRRGDRRINAEGKVRPAIVGKVVLDRGGDRVADTDAGRLDRDQRFDRVVGPMLLTPDEWSVVAVDGDGDGKRDPQDLDDATLALAVLLCARGKDLWPRAVKKAALERIDDAPDFVWSVLAVGAAYRRQIRSGVDAAPVPPPITIPVLPTVPAAPPADRTPPSSTSGDSGPTGDDEVERSGRGDGADLATPQPEPQPEPEPEPEPEPDPEPTTTDLTATYDGSALQIHATAVVSAGTAPSGAVTFTMTGPAGVEVVTPVLAGGVATAHFAVTAPGAYTVTATFAGGDDHTGSEDTVVVQVAAAP